MTIDFQTKIAQLKKKQKQWPPDVYDQDIFIYPKDLKILNIYKMKITK